MPITQTVVVELPTYEEIRYGMRLRQVVEQPSVIGLRLVAGFRWNAAKHMTYLDRREALLGARAMLSLAREYERDAMRPNRWSNV